MVDRQQRHACDAVTTSLMPSIRRIAMQDKTDSFYTDMQRYIAVATVGPSAILMSCGD